MNLGLISQIKNEIDIIEPFLRHIDAIFDIVYLLDHRSSDGTENILKQAVSQRPNWKYYLLDFHGKYQKQISNFFMHKIFERGIDFLFFLDADEFIQTSDRSILEEKLLGNDNQFSLAKMRWVNCVPVNLNLSQVRFTTRLYRSSQKSSFFKAIIPRSTYINNKAISISTGNHVVFTNDENELQGEEIGTLVHIPIRSEKQAIKKALTTAITLSAIANTPPGEHYQYYEFLRSIATGNLNKEMLQYFAALYDTPEFIGKLEYNHSYWKQKQPISLAQIPIAFSQTLRFQQIKKSESLNTIFADLLLQQKQLTQDEPKLTVGGKVVRLKNEPEVINESLTKDYFYQAFYEQISALENALNEAKQKIKDYETNNQFLSNEIKKREQEILFYACSKSWQITRPLRKIMTIIRGNKNVS